MIYSYTFKIHQPSMPPSRHLIGTTEINADMKSIEAYVARQFLVMSSHLKRLDPPLIRGPLEKSDDRNTHPYIQETLKVGRH